MTNIPLPNESELLRKIANSDQQAFAQIVSHYTRVIYPLLLSYLKNAAQAEELTQDIFMRIWNNRQKLESMDNFPGYVYVITRNRANTAFKAKLAELEKAPLDALQELLSQPDNSAIEVKEMAKVLNAAIAALPPRRKEVFLMSRMENLTYEEIAARLNISRSAVRQHMVEALAFLRTDLKEKLGVIVSMIIWSLLFES